MSAGSTRCTARRCSTSSGELAALGEAGAHTRGLLRESARIALEELTVLTAPARALAARWDEQSILEPGADSETLSALSTELERIAQELRRLKDRQREIARHLRSRLAGAQER